MKSEGKLSELFLRRGSSYVRVNTNSIINLMIKLTMKVCDNEEDPTDIQKYLQCDKLSII